VINKPAGMPVQGDRSGDPDLLTLGKAYIKQTFNKPGNVFLGLVHRLDRPVSGVMVFARTSKAASRLSEQFRSHEVHKQYLAVVEGECTGSGRLVDYIVKEKQRVFITEQSHAGAREAVLLYETLVYMEGLSLVKIELITGRPHQIRIQLAHIGLPILGDLRYGASRSFDGRNLALHCYLLGVTHPTRKEPLEWCVTPPESWGHTFTREIDALCTGAK